MSLFRLCSYGKDKHIAECFAQNQCYMLLNRLTKCSQIMVKTSQYQLFATI